MDHTLPADFQPSAEELVSLQKLAHEYATYSRDAVGLGHVFGGLLVFLLLWLLKRDSLAPWEGFLLGLTPLSWIIGKEYLRANYYQFSGRVTQPPRRWHNLILGILAGLIASGTAATLLAYRLNQPFSWKLALNTTVCIVLFFPMPFLTWRYFRAPYEFVTGVFLFSLSAFLLSGNLQIATRFANASGIAAGLVALVMVLAGCAEHMKFLKLRRRVRALKEKA